MAKIRAKWFARADCVRFFDLSTNRFDRELRPLIGDEDVKRKGRNVFFRGRALVDAWTERRLEIELRKQRKPPADPLTSGRASPALERYRLAKARAEEYDLEHRMGNLISRREVRTGFSLVAATLRQAGEMLQRQCGSEAHSILEDALREAERLVHDMAGEEDEHADTESSA